jgi:murein DD-endopeptidase MepM/ murein hydrolase activator NlpD
MDTGRSGRRYHERSQRPPGSPARAARGSSLPPRGARRARGRHARKSPAFFAAFTQTASEWLRRARRDGLAAKVRRYSSQFIAVAGILIVLLSVYLVRQGLLLPSSLPFGGTETPSSSAGDGGSSGSGSQTAGASGEAQAPGPEVLPGSGADSGSVEDGASVPADADAVVDAGASAPTEAPGDVPVLEQEGPDSSAVPPGDQTSVGECLAALTSPASGKVLRGFGFYYSAVFQDYRYHPGLDIGLAAGDTVRAALGGLVTGVETSPSLGLRVVISHGNGVTTVYGHLGLVLVSVGQEVSTGQAVGRAGQPGSIEADLGVHLHYEIRTGDQPIDPTPYVGS